MSEEEPTMPDMSTAEGRLLVIASTPASSMARQLLDSVASTLTQDPGEQGKVIALAKEYTALTQAEALEEIARTLRQKFEPNEEEEGPNGE